MRAPGRDVTHGCPRAYGWMDARLRPHRICFGNTYVSSCRRVRVGCNWCTWDLAQLRRCVREIDVDDDPAGLMKATRVARTAI